MPTPLVVVHRVAALPVGGPVGPQVVLTCDPCGSIGTVVTSGHASVELQRHQRQVLAWMAAQHPDLHRVLVVVGLGHATATCARPDCAWTSTPRPVVDHDPDHPRRRSRIDSRAAAAEAVTTARQHVTS